MDDLTIIAPLDCDVLDEHLVNDPDRAFGDLALLSETQLAAQAVAYTAYRNDCEGARFGQGFQWPSTLRWWNEELDTRARAAAATSAFVPQRPGTVYLLHLDSPLSTEHTAQHYIGYTRGPVLRRLNLHRKGAGAKFTRVANERAIPYFVVRTWPGSRSFERRLKRRKCGPRLCPICNPPVRRPLDDDTSDIPF